MDRYKMHITVESDIAEAARRARRMAETIGFDKVQVSYVATAASELAANLFIHAVRGMLEVNCIDEPSGIELVSVDEGPGIADIKLAMQEGYSTAGGLGCGLGGIERLMDTFEIKSEPGLGTWLRTRKWR